MTGQANHQVFISHSSDDREVANAVCAALEGEGNPCWIAPRDILPGANWGEAICDAIASSRLLLLVYSTRANQSQQVARELEIATAEKVPILPFRIENVPISRSLRFFLAAQQWLDASEGPLEQHLPRLTAAVEALLTGGDGFRQREQRALRDVDAVLATLKDAQGPVSLEQACSVTRAAIRQGAPIYNDGSHDGCARIYLHAVRGLVGLLGRGPNADPNPLKDARFAREELASVVQTYPTITSENATEAAWALRKAFDRLPLRGVLLHGLQEVDVAIEAAGVAGPLTLARAAEILGVALLHGNVLYQEQDLEGCAELHLHTARRLLTVVETGGDAGEDTRALRKKLGPFAAEPRPEESPRDLAWRLYEAFLKVLRAAGIEAAGSPTPTGQQSD
jgi:TIR domain